MMMRKEDRRAGGLIESLMRVWAEPKADNSLCIYGAVELNQVGGAGKMYHTFVSARNESSQDNSSTEVRLF